MFSNLNTKVKLSLLSIIALITLLIIGVLGIIQLQKVNEGLDTVYNDRVVPLEKLKIIADEYAINVVDTTHQTRNGNFTFDKCVTNIATAQDTIHSQWEQYIATKLTRKEKALANDVENFMKNADDISSKIQVACQNRDLELISEITVNELYPMIDPIGEKISALISLQLTEAKNETDFAFKIYKTSKIIIIATIIIGFGLIFIIGLMTIQDISKKLNNFSLGLGQFFQYLN